MLVPFGKILCQKGDIIDINLINKTLSQPTLGPLFGSFKLHHLATEQVFKSEKEAQKVIDATDWNIVAALIYACKEADQWEEKQKEVSKKEEE